MVPTQGAHTSSTRAEAMALLATLFLPRPIYAASDSKIAVDKIKRILGETNQCPPITGASAVISVAGPWGKASKPNSKYADIWVLMARALRARGPHTFDILKVKAHCTRQQMEEGQISQRNWLFNQAADGNASMGTMPPFWIPEHEQTALQAKVARSRTIVRAIHDSMLAVLRASKETTREPVAVPSRARKRGPAKLAPIGVLSPPPYEQAFQPRSFSHLLPAPRALEMRARRWDGALRTFIRSHEWSHAQLLPMPWLMLMIMFEQASRFQVSEHAKLDISPLLARSTCKSLVQTFRTVFLRILKNDLHPECRQVFMSQSTGKHAGAQVGWQGFDSCLTAWPILSPDAFGDALIACLSLRPDYRTDWRQRLREGSLEVPLCSSA